MSEFAFSCEFSELLISWTSVKNDHIGEVQGINI